MISNRSLEDAVAYEVVRQAKRSLLRNITEGKHIYSSIIDRSANHTDVNIYIAVIDDGGEAIILNITDNVRRATKRKVSPRDNFSIRLDTSKFGAANDVVCQLSEILFPKAEHPISAIEHVSL